MVLSLPQSKLLPSDLLAFGRNQPNGAQKLQCGFWAESCSGVGMPQV
jgi:hypothetical protein